MAVEYGKEGILVIGLVRRSGDLKVVYCRVLHLLAPACFYQKEVPLIYMQMYYISSFLPLWVIFVVSAFECDEPMFLYFLFIVSFYNLVNCKLMIA